MQNKTKSAKKKIPTIRKYSDGYFVDANNMNSATGGQKRNQIAGGLNTISGIIGAGQNPNRTSVGGSTAQGALNGAAMGYQNFGLIGAGVGAVAGGAIGLFGAKNKQRGEYERDMQFNADQLSNTDATMNHANVNPYGNQMYEYGDFIEDPIKGKRDTTVNKNAPTYDPSLLAANGKFMVEKKDGSLGQWGNPLNSTYKPSVVPQLNPSKDSAIYSPTYNNLGQLGYNQPRNPTPAVIKSNGSAYGHYEDGDEIQGNPNNQPMADAVNTQQNVINIQKGELLIHPETGKILQEFSGINPLTGGAYEPHAKGKKKESSDNFTMADPGLFVITKKTAKQYKDSMDNNDKISQKTVLMNIRNAKIAKNGGLKNYAYGDTIQDPDPFAIPGTNGIKALNVTQFNPPQFNPNLFSTSGVKFNPTPVSYSRSPEIVNTPMNNNSYANTSIPANAGVPVRQLSNVTPSNNSFNPSGILDNLNKYGPSLVNLAQGVFGKTDIQPYARPITNPYTNQVLQNLPQDVDMSPIINDIRSNQNLANKDLLNSTNNSAVYRANRQQLDANVNKATTNARMLSQDQNNRVRGQRGAIYNQLGEQSMQDASQRRQYDLGVDDINARRSAAKQNLFNAGLSQLQQTSMNDKANGQKAALDKYTLGLMAQIFPNLKYYDQFDAEKINKKLGR